MISLIWHIRMGIASLSSLVMNITYGLGAVREANGGKAVTIVEELALGSGIGFFLLATIFGLIGWFQSKGGRR